jgi:hypothetical protein
MNNKPSAARNVGLANRSSEQAGVAPFAKGYGGTLRRPRQQTKRREDIAGTTGTRARSPRPQVSAACLRPSSPDQQTERSEGCWRGVWDDFRNWIVYRVG